MSHKILVIDDDPFVTDMLDEFLSSYYKVKVALSGNEGIKKLQSFKPDIVLLDIRMPEMDGFTALSVIKKLDSECKVIMITANQDAKSAVKCMKLGAYDYIVKPFDIDEIKITIDRAIDSLEASKKVLLLEEELKEKYSFNKIVTCSKIMEPVLSLLQKIINTDTIVLLRGESGTGKELIARVIHFNSNRYNKPFIAVNTSAIPETLLESELFGFEKGSFTGAISSKPGKFELAEDGTVFLDEIGTMPYNLQSKLLRVIQEKEFSRIGGTEPIKLNARIITATNVNLEEAMEKNLFRKDLFYRLNVLPVFIPPLREHKEDIPLLITHFIEIMNKRFGRAIENVEERALKILMDYNWPGNVRELENFIERVVVMSQAEDKYITLKHIQEAMDLFTFSPKARSVLLSVGDSIEEMEKRLIKATLEETDGKIIKAAEILGITRKTLREKLKKFGLYTLFKDDGKDDDNADRLAP
ncbi:MAG: sigma-54 dependent transcriptional regulator [Candidatus Hydrogenedentota bacterium]